MLDLVLLRKRLEGRGVVSAVYHSVSLSFAGHHYQEPQQTHDPALHLPHVLARVGTQSECKRQAIMPQLAYGRVIPI